jgi:hypothetical protein
LQSSHANLMIKVSNEEEIDFGKARNKWNSNIWEEK